MKITLTILLSTLVTGSLTARPGELLPDSFPDLRTEAIIEASAVDSTGGVFIYGNFDSIDGTPRPGLAKLHPDGTLDPSFSPSVPCSQNRN